MIELDLERAEERKLQGLRRLNTWTIPLTRLVGFGLLLVALVISGSQGEGTLYAAYPALTLGYSLASWAILARFYRPDARVDLGLLFLMLDVPLFCLAVVLTGGPASWFALALILRVADQIPAGVRRILLFCHWNVLCYVAILAFFAPLSEIIGRGVLLYLAGLYLLAAALAAERSRARHNQTLRYARELLAAQKPLMDYIALLGTETDLVLRSLDALRQQQQAEQQTTGEACSTSREISREANRLAHQIAVLAVDSQDASSLVVSGRSLLSQTRERLQSLVQAYEGLARRLGQLEEIARQIDSVTRTMSTVAYQTNLLSLNAAIEASHAGEAGRSFAVVATEIRRLAGTADENSVEIANLVKRVQSSAVESVASMRHVGQQVGESEKSLEETVGHLVGVLDRVETMSGRFEGLHRDIRSLSKQAGQIRGSLENVTETGKETSGSLEGIHGVLLRILELAPGKEAPRKEKES